MNQITSTSIAAVPAPVLRRPLVVQLHSKDTAIKVSLAVEDPVEARAVLMLERVGASKRSAAVTVTVNGTTAEVVAMRHMTARAIAERIAQELSGKDPLLACEVKLAIADGEDVDAVLLEVRAL